MKYIMTPDQVKRMMDDILKKKNVKVDIMYLNDNGRDSITATVYLYKDGEVMGYKQGYEFFFNYDKRFDKLTPDGNYPKLQNLNFFKNLPDEVITQYFTDKSQEYLRGYIDRGNVHSFKVVNK